MPSPPVIPAKAVASGLKRRQIPIIPAKAVASGLKQRQIPVIPAKAGIQGEKRRQIPVIPAKAGIQGEKPFFALTAKGWVFGLVVFWIPAFAGMTEKGQP